MRPRPPSRAYSMPTARIRGCVSARIGACCAGRGAGLQRHHDRTEVDARQLDRGVVDAGEAEDADEIAGSDRILAWWCQSPATDCARVHSVAVGDRVEARQQAKLRASGRGIGHHLAGPLAERRPVGITRPSPWPSPRRCAGLFDGPPRLPASSGRRSGTARPGIQPFAAAAPDAPTAPARHRGPSHRFVRRTPCHCLSVEVQVTFG